MQSKKASKAQLILIIFGVILVLTASIVYLILNRKNIHLVKSNGQTPIIYRSGQLKPKDFRQLLEEKKIDIVLNLRGKRDDQWYYDEVAITDEMGVEYYSYGFPDTTLPKKKRFIQILELFDYAKENNLNTLIHCKAGADRAGMISAVAQIYLYSFTTEEASKSLTPLYGHIPNSKSPLEQVLKAYAEVDDRMNFKEWLMTEYKYKDVINEEYKN